MAEPEPNINKYAGMTPEELDQQLEVAKVLLPSASITEELKEEGQFSSYEKALQFSAMYDRRVVSEGYQRGAQAISSVRPSMIVTEWMQQELVKGYKSVFGAGIEDEDRSKHLLEIVFQDAKFPEGFNLIGALFVPHRSVVVETAVFRSELAQAQEMTDIFDSIRANPRKGPSPFQKDISVWLSQIRVLHGPNSI